MKTFEELSMADPQVLINMPWFNSQWGNFLSVCDRLGVSHQHLGTVCISEVVLPPAIPEPSTLVMLVLGLILIAIHRFNSKA